MTKKNDTNSLARFPDAVITAMHHAGTTVTCLPVQMSEAASDVWVAAIFFVLPESWDNKKIKQTFSTGALLSVGLAADLLEQDSATLISLEVELNVEGDPLAGEILFIPGHLEAHHETVNLLSEQSGIDLFIGDKFCNLLHQQTIPLEQGHRDVFAELLKEASSRDALIRFRGQYDPQAAFDALLPSAGAGVWMPEPPKPSDQS